MLNANQLEINLGTLKFGIPHEFRFELINTGVSAIVINGISLGCHSCTKASMDRSIIEPGGRDYLNVIFTPGSKGVNIKGITIVYNTNQELKLKFRANVDD